MANIILEGLTTDQFADLLRETVRGEMGNLRSQSTATQAEYMSRKEVMALLEIQSTTLWSWEKTGYIQSFPFGGRKRYKRTDVEAIRTGRKGGRYERPTVGKASTSASPRSRRQR